MWVVSVERRKCDVNMTVSLVFEQDFELFYQACRTGRLVVQDIG